jgi:ABC-type cobalamin/Fe3+-siderophores transport system ATPase subunit
MEQFDLTIGNYRCFDQREPARIRLGPGFVAFVGPNNSGKTSLLRYFYELRRLWSAFLPNHLPSMIYQPWGMGTPIGTHDPSEVFCHLNDGDIYTKISLVEPATDFECNTLELSAKRSTTSLWKAKLSTSRGVAAQHITAEAAELSHESQAFEATRILSVLSGLSDAMYVGAFRNALNTGATDYYDLKVGTQFVEQWDEWKNGPDKSKNGRIQEATADIQRILGFESLEVNASSDRTTLQVFVDRRPYRLYELGSGLAQFIVTFGAVVTRQPSIVLIDEPELNLHPSLQVDFLTSLGKYAKHGVWFSTHSIGLARTVADLVYAVQRPMGWSVVAPLSSTKNYALFLGEMSFTAFRELGFEKVLLVEGPSEVKTLQQWLRLYQKEHRCVIIHMGGSSSINANSAHELSELKRITANVAVLIDSERTFEDEKLAATRDAFVRDCLVLGFDVHVTERRATENYLTERAIRAEKGSKYSALEPYQLLKSAVPAWAKHENWRIAARMRKQDLDDTDLGEFLARV